MTFEHTVVELMKYSRNTYYVWKREKRPIISLLEKYFTKEDLAEFIEHQTIQRLDLLNSNSKYGMQLAIIKNYIDYIQDIIVESIKNIENGCHFTELPFYIYFDFLNFVNNYYSESDIFLLIDEVGCRQIVLKKILYDYFQKNEKLYDPTIFHFLSNFNLISSTYILDEIRYSFNEIYKFARVYDIKIVYFHYIFQSFYNKQINYQDLIILAKEKKEKQMKTLLSSTLDSLFI